MTLKDDLTKTHFEHICAQTNYFNDKLTESYTFFAQTLTAIVGGSIWLSVNKDNPLKLKTMSEVVLSDSLVLLLTIITVIRVFGNYTAWWGARDMQHAMLASVPLPHWFRSAWMEVALAISVMAACVLFFLENPFRVFAAN